jgi:hypothetical protein
MAERRARKLAAHASRCLFICGPPWQFWVACVATLSAPARLTAPLFSDRALDLFREGFWIRSVWKVFAVGDNFAKPPKDRFHCWLIFHDRDLAVPEFTFRKRTGVAQFIAFPGVLTLPTRSRRIRTDTSETCCRYKGR